MKTDLFTSLGPDRGESRATGDVRPSALQEMYLLPLRIFLEVFENTVNGPRIIDPRLASSRYYLDKLSFLLLLIISAFLIGCSDYFDEIKAKRTAGDMRSLSIFLNTQHPDSVDTLTIQSLSTKNNYPVVLSDAWGSEFLIEIQDRPSHNEKYYSIRSLGSDRKPGPCCTRWTDDFSDDAIIEDGEWVQIWR